MPCPNRILAPLALVLACQPAAPRSNARPGAKVDCQDGTTRPAMDCQTELGLRERVVAANATLGQLGLGIGGRYEERAKGQVTDSTYQLALKLESLCSEYNACAITSDRYSDQAQRIREQLTTHVAMVGSLQSGVTAEAGDRIWTNAVPDLAAARLELGVRVETSSRGGATTLHRDGAPLHSGDRMRIVVTPSVDAHVYILLLASNGEPSVLFPHPAMPLHNPLPGGRDIAIPNDGTFALDAVTGEEHIQVLASRTPLSDIEARLAAMAHQKPGKAPEQGVLGAIGNLLCDEPSSQRGIEYRKSSASCEGRRTRGIVYEKDGATPTLAARPNDDVIVYQHRIDHR
jgi:hypothetical protein